MTTDTRQYRAVLALFFTSGAVGLLYQVVWVRLFIHVFGATVLAVSTVLAAFMTGLALGGMVGGRYVHRLQRPLRAYALAELGLVACAAALPFVLKALDPLYATVYPSLSENFTLLSAVRFLVGVAVLLPPTFLMGATLPFLVSHAERTHGTARPRVAHLYAVNTFGAVAGTAASSFLLLPSIGLTRTLLVGLALNLTVALVALALGRRAAVASTASDALPDAADDASSDPASLDHAAAPPRTLVLLTAGALGLSALAFEVIWTRALALALGTTTYAFAIVLTVFLLGIAGGSAWAARILRGPPARARAIFIACPAVIGLLALTLLPLFDQLPALFVRLSGLGSGSWTEGLAIRFLLAGVPLLPPTFLSGAAFPLAVGMIGRAGRTGRAVGDAYAANTFGAILGSWAAGFLLIPVLGLRTGVVVAAAIPIAATCLLLAARPGLPARAGALAVAVLAALVSMVLPDWDHAALTRSGFATTIAMRRSRDGELSTDRRELVFLEEGITSTITVRRRGDELTMQMNGVTEASNTGDIATQVFVGGFGSLLHPRAQDVLVIGLGSGITAHAAMRVPGVRSLECVEISEAVVNAARFFDEWNGQLLDDPRARVIIGDGRNHLQLSGRKYDVIVSQPSHVWNAGIGSLMSAEFYRAAADHLNDGGILVSWIQGYALSSDALRSVLAAVSESFPRVSLWMAGWSDLVIVAGDDELAIDVERLQERGRDANVGAMLRDMAAPDVVTLLSQNILAGSVLQRYVGNARSNTDDNLLLEFEAPKLLHRETLPELIASFDRASAGTEELITNAPPGLLEQLAVGLRARSIEDDAWIAFHQGAGVDGLELIEQAWTLFPTAPQIADLFSSALAGRGETKARRGDAAGAGADFVRAAEVAPWSAKPFMNLARLYRDTGQLRTAMEASDEALRREPRNAEALADRADIQLRVRDGEGAERLARSALSIDQWVRDAHRVLGASLARQERLEEADSVFAEGLRLHPDDEALATTRTRLIQGPKLRGE